MTWYAMAIDVDRCVGCQACLVACKAENEVPFGIHRLRMREVVVGVFPQLHGEFHLMQCFHCEHPPWVPVCPTGATFQTEDGLVLLDPSKCIGCKACVTACPYGMRTIHPRGVVDKCTFCNHRLEVGMEPACVETCPTGARVFGDLDDPTSPLHAALNQTTRVDVWKPETGAGPKLFYLNSRFLNTQADVEEGDVVSVLVEPSHE